MDAAIKDLHILLVEDNPAEARLVAELLQVSSNPDIFLRQVGTLQDALQELRDGEYSVCLLDLNLPDSQGLDTFIQLSAEASPMPVVVLSGLNERELASSAVERGAQDYLAKDETLTSASLWRSIRYAIGRHQVEQEHLNQEKQDLQAEKMESLGRFAGGIAHEFNNLLATILGYAHVVETAVPTGKVNIKDVQEIVLAAGKASALTDQLLMVGHERKYQLEPVELNSLILNIQAMFPRILGTEIDITLDLEEKLLLILAERRILEQAVWNLLIHAKDAMDEGGKITLRTENLTITSDTRDQFQGMNEGEAVRLTVEDTGPGMGEEASKRIFEPFYHDRDVQKGLGLSAIYGMTKSIGGFVEFHSTEGEGSRVHVVLPAQRPEVLKLAPPEPVVPGEGETILLVEDEKALRRLIARNLTGLGYEVLEAHHPSAALDIARLYQGTLDIVLTDIMMPDMDGPSLVSELKKLRTDFKPLYMSGYTYDSLEALGIVASEEDLLAKPFDKSSLSRKIRTVLQAG